MIRSTLRLIPKNGNYDALVEFYKNKEIIENVVRRGLCVSGELLVPTDRNAPVIVSCLWVSPEAYDAWVSERGDGDVDLKKLLELEDGKVPPGETLSVEISA